MIGQGYEASFMRGFAGIVQVRICGTCSGGALQGTRARLVGANFVPLRTPFALHASGLPQRCTPPHAASRICFNGLGTAPQDRLSRPIARRAPRRSKLRSAQNPLCASRTGASSPRCAPPHAASRAGAPGCSSSSPQSFALRGFFGLGFVECVRAGLCGKFSGRASRVLLSPDPLSRAIVRRVRRFRRRPYRATAFPSRRRCTGCPRCRRPGA